MVEIQGRKLEQSPKGLEMQLLIRASYLRDVGDGATTELLKQATLAVRELADLREKQK